MAGKRNVVDRARAMTLARSVPQSVLSIKDTYRVAGVWLRVVKQKGRLSGTKVVEGPGTRMTSGMQPRWPDLTVNPCEHLAELWKRHVGHTTKAGRFAGLC